MVTATVSVKVQLLVVPQRCISYVTHNAASLLVVRWLDRARPVLWVSTLNSTSLWWGQLRCPGALLTHSCPEAASAHYWLLSGITAPPLPWVCVSVWVCVQLKKKRKKCSLGRKRYCDDQVTDAHDSNVHLIAKERRFSRLSWSYHVKHQTPIRYSMIWTLWWCQ